MAGDAHEAGSFATTATSKGLGEEWVLSVWLGVSMRFVISLTVTPAFYIVLERLHDPLAVARSVSCRSRVGEVPWRTAVHNHLGILFAGFLTGKTRMSGAHLELCAVCDAVVAGWAEGDNVCATCGMTLVEPPFEGSDYFDMIMRAGRPHGRAARRQRPDRNLPY